MRAFTLVLVMLVAIAACGTAGFQPKTYGIAPLEGEVLRGRLQGVKPEDDLALDVCQPDEQVRGKCRAMLEADYQVLIAKLRQYEEMLKGCEERGSEDASE